MQRRLTAVVLCFPLVISACADEPAPVVTPGRAESGPIYGADNR